MVTKTKKRSTLTTHGLYRRSLSMVRYSSKTRQTAVEIRAQVERVSTVSAASRSEPVAREPGTGSDSGWTSCSAPIENSYPSVASGCWWQRNDVNGVTSDERDFPRPKVIVYHHR